MPRTRVAGALLATTLAALAMLLLSGCELREGDPREYGDASAGDGPSVHKVVDRELLKP